MTRRPYAPELRNIPLTFMDCDARGTEGAIFPRMAFCAWHRGMATCEEVRNANECPRGFQ